MGKLSVFVKSNTLKFVNKNINYKISHDGQKTLSTRNTLNLTIQNKKTWNSEQKSPNILKFQIFLHVNSQTLMYTKN